MSHGLHALVEPDDELPSPPAPVPMFPAAAVNAYVSHLEAEIESLREQLHDLRRRLDSSPGSPGAEKSAAAPAGDVFDGFLDDLHGGSSPSPEPHSDPARGPSGNAE